MQTTIERIGRTSAHQVAELAAATMLTLGVDGVPSSRGVRRIGGLALRLLLARRALRSALLATAGRWLAARKLPGAALQTLDEPRSTHLAGVITIGKPADELFALWRDPDALHAILAPLADVSSDGDGRATWRMPIAGQVVQWETELTEARPGELLRWRSRDGAPATQHGSLRLVSAGERGTEVELRMRVSAREDPLLAGGFGVEARFLVQRALHRFKSLAETGEAPTIERQPSGRAGER